MIIREDTISCGADGNIVWVQGVVKARDIRNRLYLCGIKAKLNKISTAITGNKEVYSQFSFGRGIERINLIRPTNK